MTFAIDQELPQFVIEHVSPEGMKVWAKALHDPNPIHLDADFVKAKGWGDRVINQGPANAAYVINMLMAAFPGAMVRDVDVRYIDNVFGGEKVVAGGTIVDIADEGPRRAVACNVWLKAEGRDVISGKAVVLVD